MSQPERPATDDRRPHEGAPGTARSNPTSLQSLNFHRLWSLAIGGGLLAGLISWGCGEQTYSAFRPVIVQPANWGKMNGYERADFRSSEEGRQKPSVGRRNGALVFGVLGFALGGMLGLAGGLARRSIGSGSAAAAFGSIAGGLAGVAASWVTIPGFYRFVDPEMGLAAPMITHACIFATIGAAGGASLGLGLGGRRNVLSGLLGGLFGGIVGALVYDVVASILFAEMRVYDPIPKEVAERLPRLMMHLCAALFAPALAVTFLLAGAGSHSPGSKASSNRVDEIL